MNNLEYIIVQAGGKGTRMENLTRNKPKALVPVNHLPLIFHLFKKYPNSEFIIISEYKYDVMEKYLATFAEVNYRLVNSEGHVGTCSGLKKALEYVPEQKKFMLIWCDLLLPSDFTIMDSEKDIIGISKDFQCRWKYENGEFFEEKSQTQGVAGLFVFKDKKTIIDVIKSI